MANKSFVIQYIIKARDRFSRVSDTISNKLTKLKKRVDRAKKSFKSFSASARKVGAVLTAAVTTPMLFMAKALKNAARDAEETRSKFKQVFQDVAKESEIVADSFAKNYGLAGTTSRALLSDTGDLFAAIGVGGKEALSLSVKVNQLAVDLASFKNFSGGAVGASNALTKALLGERESLKSLGVAISEKDVKARISKLVSEGQRFQSLKQAKAIATLSLAYEQSKNAIGDFSRTQHQLANEERKTAEELKTLREELGVMLLPVALKITRAIRSMSESFRALSPTTKKIIVGLAAFIAIIGPLLILLGSISLIIPVISAALSALGVIAGIVFSPITLAVAAIATAAFLVIDNWAEVKLFFEAFGDRVVMIFDWIMERIDNMKKGLSNFVDIIPDIPSFSDVKSKFQDVKSTFSDIKLPSFDDVTGNFFSSEDKETSVKLNNSRVDVGVNVGLDAGLKQTSKPVVQNNNVRRMDVGFAGAGL